MLTEELPGWLEERGLATNPFAVLGISMGGYGALNYAANLERPGGRRDQPGAVPRWPEARPATVFADRDAVGRTPTRCATLGAPVTAADRRVVRRGDPFIDAPGARRHARSRPSADIEPGDHDAAFWRRCCPTR